MNDNVTHHWSGSGDDGSGYPARLRDYTLEIARAVPSFTDDYKHALRAAWLDPNGAHSVDFALLKRNITVYKNHDLEYVPVYDTWNWNTDPRDGVSPNICIASLCLPHGATDFSGDEPFTIVHAWAHAYAGAVIAEERGLDCLESWPNPNPAVYQNGPMFTFDTHSGRAIQTVDWGVPDAGASSQAASRVYGYFFGSGDPQSRADLFCLDAEWYTGAVTISQARESAARIRAHSHVIKAGGLISDRWGIDQAPT